MVWIPQLIDVLVSSIKWFNLLSACIFLLPCCIAKLEKLFVGTTLIFLHGVGRVVTVFSFQNNVAAFLDLFIVDYFCVDVNSLVPRKAMPVFQSRL